MELQKTLDGEKILYNNNSSCGIYLKLWKRKDDHIWKVLQYFYHGPMEGITVPQIYKKAKTNHCRFGINTVANCIKRLLDEEMIRLKYTNVGSKKRTNMYEITQKGEILWEHYIKQK